MSLGWAGAGRGPQRCQRMGRKLTELAEAVEGSRCPGVRSGRGGAGLRRVPPRARATRPAAWSVQPAAGGLGGGPDSDSAGLIGRSSAKLVNPAAASRNPPSCVEPDPGLSRRERGGGRSRVQLPPSPKKQSCSPRASSSPQPYFGAGRGGVSWRSRVVSHPVPASCASAKPRPSARNCSRFRHAPPRAAMRLLNFRKKTRITRHATYRLRHCSLRPRPPRLLL